MRCILVLGAGRSSSSLIDFLLKEADAENWEVIVGDVTHEAAREKVGSHPRGSAIAFDIQHDSASEPITKSDIVISLLPASLHSTVARKCLLYKKHLLTASYISDDMKSLDSEARAKDILFLNECGLDPGIDHMSAMQVIDRIKADGGDLNSFESFTGGLIAPQTDRENPWRYKFTWNPRNVVMAGQGTARFLQDGQFKYIPYQQLFSRITPVTVPGYGEFEGYANRDSLKYRETYGLQNIKTMLRGTLRNKGFCPAWDILVQLGCTDDSYSMEDVGSMTHKKFISSFLDSGSASVQEKLSRRFNVKMDGPELARLGWTGMYDNTVVGLQVGTPAEILEHILNKRWKLQPEDRDMIVMWHRFRYMKDNREKEIQATLIAIGENSVQTAMAKTVGLPLGLAAKELLNGKIRARGVLVPTTREFYEPILAGLKAQGIELTETA
jgi:saccharopine dehydrogenase-like NADP-dependent oxidoreductase